MLSKMLFSPLQNLTIFGTLQKRVGFSEVTGGRALSFRNGSMGETAGLPLDRAGGNAEGAKLPRRYVTEKTSPRALELKKSSSSLKKYELCKGLAVIIAGVNPFFISYEDTLQKRCIHIREAF